jgi:hypothetical protein
MNAAHKSIEGRAAGRHEAVLSATRLRRFAVNVERGAHPLRRSPGAYSLCTSARSVSMPSSTFWVTSPVG